MLRTSLLFLLDSRYEEDKAKKLYEDVKNNIPEKISTELSLSKEGRTRLSVNFARFDEVLSRDENIRFYVNKCES